VVSVQGVGWILDKCPEIRDSGGTVIRDWFRRHYGLPWPKGNPPRFQVIPVSDNRFRVLP
jgi:hypothetical protein